MPTNRTRIEEGLSKLFEVAVKRGPMAWDAPHVRATDADGVVAAVKEAMASAFVSIEVRDVSHWNSPSACSVTLTEDCPRMEGGK